MTRWAAAACVVGVLASVAGCGIGGEVGGEGDGPNRPAGATTAGRPSASEVGGSSDVALAFDDAPGADAVGGAPTTFANHGFAEVAIVVVSADGGEFSLEAAGDGTALRTPAFAPTMPAPRAVLQVVGRGADDVLDPGSGPFTFGASFVLDEESSSDEVGSVDDGDNLLQRGLYEEASQFKLELDGGRPLCRVKGADGDVSVVGSARVEPGRWYRATCARLDDRVVLTLIDLEVAGDAPAADLWLGELGVDDGDEADRPAVQRWERVAATGSMAPASPQVPLSVGGKLRDGEVDWNTDQFNGLIDDVVLSIG